MKERQGREPVLSTALPGRRSRSIALGSVDGWFDMLHLDVPKTRGKVECTIRKRRLGRERRGEISAP
jgi:hypothetical protein